ncbi:ruBisCO large subunit-binding protein subunit alpha-like [Pyrus ussuriensis x Pyrus communis]|uniref:RuBisCO large subunit-binding protein subunit alpha-like n=1 Tax=Pyrus ussuriensis x Pyrus communis TaxID=2448454 RepID=A0A5N5GQU6_9ROSA|nr:ruBisCO large subunit-binding protein subunit alpha-like [Pyrus ussuriensis x Pyrus communis]
MELLVMSGACRLTEGRRIHEYMLKVGLTGNSQVTNAQLILKHGGAASAIASKALVLESLRRGVNYRQSRLCSVMKSSAKEIAFDQHFQHALQGGIDKLAGVIGLTFGPRGRNVVNEGVKFGRAIELPHDVGTTIERF